jgi:hypothetical protein
MPPIIATAFATIFASILSAAYTNLIATDDGNGLYESSSLRQIAPANGARLANQRYGRRVIDQHGQALVFADIQLSWLNSAGVCPIRHGVGAFEAVVDSSGGNIVYVEAAVGKLHWIATDDKDLGFTGAAPALSDDGRSPDISR